MGFYWPAFWSGFRRPAPALQWKCQFASYLPPPDDIDALLHYAVTLRGTFEIYDDGRNFLLSFPRGLRLPAELFTSLADAKARALAALSASQVKP